MVKPELKPISEPKASTFNLCTNTARDLPPPEPSLSPSRFGGCLWLSSFKYALLSFSLHSYLVQFNAMLSYVIDTKNSALSLT